MEKVVIGVSGAMMNSGIAEFGIKELGMHASKADHWMMHPWQAMQILNYIEIEKAWTAGEPGWKFEQIRVVEDPRFPEDLIELRDKDENVLVEFRNVGSISRTTTP